MCTCAVRNPCISVCSFIWLGPHMQVLAQYFSSSIAICFIPLRQIFWTRSLPVSPTNSFVFCVSRPVLCEKNGLVFIQGLSHLNLGSYNSNTLTSANSDVYNCLLHILVFLFLLNCAFPQSILRLWMKMKLNCYSIFLGCRRHRLS
jgi:hypothetical protein